MTSSRLKIINIDSNVPYIKEKYVVVDGEFMFSDLYISRVGSLLHYNESFNVDNRIWIE